MINPKQVKRQFEKSFKDYDKNAIVQEIMAEDLLENLIKISNNFNYVLEMGAGTGLLTKRFINKIKYKQYYANDIVEKSKTYIEKIAKDINFVSGNALKIKPDKKMDLIISNAMFQWFENFDKSIEIVKKMLGNNGIIAFSTFSPNNFKEIKEITGLTLSYNSKENLIDILKAHNFEIIFSEEFEKEITFNTALELLVHMKKTGVNSLSEKNWTIKEVRDFCQKFEQKSPTIKLTYAPIIIIARKV